MHKYGHTVLHLINKIPILNVTRFLYIYMCSMRLRNKKRETTLSEYVWSLIDGEIEYEISWKFLRQVHYYSPTSKQCLLCLSEKF